MTTGAGMPQACWDAFTTNLAEALRPWVRPRVLARFMRYQEASARVIFLYVSHAPIDPKAVHETCGTAITMCAAGCMAGVEQFDHQDATTSKTAVAVRDAFTAARPTFEALLDSLPGHLADLAREKYNGFAQLMAAIAATDNAEVDLLIESMAEGMHASVNRFAVRHPEHDGQGAVGSPAWEQRRRAWARGERL